MNRSKLFSDLLATNHVKEIKEKVGKNPSFLKRRFMNLRRDLERTIASFMKKKENLLVSPEAEAEEKKVAESIALQENHSSRVAMRIKIKKNR